MDENSTENNKPSHEFTSENLDQSMNFAFDVKLNHSTEPVMNASILAVPSNEQPHRPRHTSDNHTKATTATTTTNTITTANTTTTNTTTADTPNPYINITNDEHSKLPYIEVDNLTNRSLNSFIYNNYVNSVDKSPTRKVYPIKADYDLDSMSGFFVGKPSTNGYVINKVNPVMNSEFSYLNRNKLVNRRLAIKKTLQNSMGLQSWTNPYINNDAQNTKLSSEFTLANPADLYIRDDVSVDSSNYYYNNNHEQLNNTFLTSSNNEEAFSHNHNQEKNLFKPMNKVSNSDLSQKKVAKSSQIVIIEKKGFRMENDDGPTPFSYHIPRRPLHEKISPMFSIGKRNFKEKTGGGRTSWQKEWYNSNNPFTYKSDYNREAAWPAPNNYKIKSALGDTNVSLVYPHAPAHTIGVHRANTFYTNTTGATQESSKSNLPQAYMDNCDVIISREDLVENELKKSNYLSKKGNSAQKKNDNELNVIESFKRASHAAPKVAIKFRPKGTILWPNVEKTPGPGSYNLDKFKNIAKSSPKFSQPQAKHELNSTFSIGPYAAI